MKKLIVSGLLLGLSLAAGTAHAQTAVVVAEPAGRPDAVRVRGGVDGGAGFLVFSGAPVEPVVHVQGRVGVQFNHLWSLYYQGTLNVAVFTDGTGTMIFGNNSVLGGLTLLHMIDIGVGPSLDVVTISGTSTASDGTSTSVSGTTALGGLDGRVAFNIGGASGTGSRRRGVSLGLDLHPTFGSGSVLFTTTFGVGYEWF